MINLKDKKINSVYLGTKKIYSSSLLPKEYQQVEYIESTGTQHINTNILYDISNNYEIIADLIALEGSDGKYFCGWNAGGSFGAKSSSYELYTGSSSLILDTRIRTQINMKINANADTTTDYIGIQSNNTQNGSRLHTNLLSYAGNLGFPIFAIASQGFIGNNSLIKLFSFSIKVNNILIRDFIPCYCKSDNEIGLYDLVNDVFYTNSGTGTFLKGGDV